MTIKLTWEDLLIQRFPPEKVAAWLAGWSGWTSGRIAPVAMTKFGDWFLRRDDGSTEELSVIEGTYERVAATPEEFESLMNQREWQEQHLLSRLVLSFHEKGIIPKEDECYAFAPHPTLTGKISLDHVMIMKIGVWQHICAETLGGRLAPER